MKNKKPTNAQEFFKKHPKLNKKLDGLIREANAKSDFLKKYVQPFSPVEYFLAYNLSEDKIREVYGKYAKGAYDNIDIIGELLNLNGNEIDIKKEYQHKKVFTVADVSKIEQLVAGFWIEEKNRILNNFLSDAEKNKAASKSEIDKLRKTVNKYVGKKVKGENLQLYCEIIETNKRRIKNSEDSNYKKSAQITLKDSSFSEDEKDQIYKNFNTWFNNPKNSELIFLLTSK